MTDLSLAPGAGLSRLRDRLGRVWTLIALIPLAVLALDAARLVPVLEIASGALLGTLPYIVVAVALIASLKASGAEAMVARAFEGRETRMIVLAGLFGGLAPFCSCEVIPFIAGLLALGAPLAAVMAFWLASPLMDPEQFILMAATLGVPFTLAKTTAAISLGLLAGGATLALQRAGWFADALRPGAGGCGGCGGPKLASAPLRWAFWREAPRRRAFADEARSTALFLSKWLLLAFAIESLMAAWLPAEVVASTLGGGSWQAIPLAVAVGVPAYLNGFAAIPLVGELMSLGMAPGAALAFLIAGGVTSLPAAMAVHALVRRTVFLWYLAVALTGSLLAGFAYQAVLALAG